MTYPSGIELSGTVSGFRVVSSTKLELELHHRGAVGTRVSSTTVSRLNPQLYERIEPMAGGADPGQFAFHLDGIWLKRS